MMGGHREATSFPMAYVPGYFTMMVAIIVA